jgi:excinuclease UvrABC nuclease subunit
MSEQVTWLSHEFTMYSPNTEWNDVGGVYIFTGRNQEGLWVALYIGQTDSFRNRIPQHEKWNPAAQRGASHVHALVVPQEATRLAIEEELIRTYRPPLNDQLK